MQVFEKENSLSATDAEGKEIAELTFTYLDESIIIVDHLYVGIHYRGQGIAKKLVQRMVEKAKQESKKIMPYCTFTRAEFRKSRAYQEVEFEQQIS